MTTGYNLKDDKRKSRYQRNSKGIRNLSNNQENKHLLGLHWMEKLGKTLATGKIVPQVHQVNGDPNKTTLKTKFKKLLNENHTANRLEVKIQLKVDAKLIQQKGRAIPKQFQQSVEKEIEKLTK